ncbi:MAG: serine/threonine-protein kinase [Ruminococcus sp.]|nr:serine/threonine-protein kinase [Ruminococcus sp.]
MEIGSYWKGWRIDRLLGEGAFGKVYKISRREMNFEYSSALKVISIPNNESEYKELRNQGMDDKSISTYFNSVAEDLMTELKIMSRLKGNTNIVSYEDHVIEQNPNTMGLKIYIRMELLTPLYDYIPSHPLTEKDIVRLGVDMCRALEVCRKYNIIHRDIKPQNIFVSELGDFKLGDFGIARRLEKTESGLSKKGTYSYMAPEVYKAEPYNPTVDIYSLGLVLYNFLNNNRTPFLPPPNQPLKYTDRENANVRRMRGEAIPAPANASDPFTAVVLKSCAFSPADRYSNATEFKNALLPLLNDPAVKDTVVYDGKTPVFTNSSSHSSANNVAPVIPVVPTGETLSASQASGQNNNQNPTNNTYNNSQGKAVQPEEKKKNKKLIPIIGASAAAVIAIVAAVILLIPKGNSNNTGTAPQSSAVQSSVETAAQSSESGGEASQSGNTVKIDGYELNTSMFKGENNITLKVWVPANCVSLTKTQVQTFVDMFPDISFKNIQVVAKSESDASAQLVNDPKSAADVFSFPSDQLDKMAAATVLSEVPSEFTGYVSSSNSASTVDASKVNSTMYAYPETADNGYCLVYDKSVISDNESATLEGVLAACKSHNRDFIMDCGNGFYSCVFAFTAGVQTDGYEADGATQKFKQYDEDEAVDTLLAFSKLMKDYKGTWKSVDPAEIATGFNNGTTGAGVEGTWNFTADKEALGSNFGAAKLPPIKVNGENKQLVSMMGYKYIGVNEQSSFPNAAHILALYLAGEKCQKERAEQVNWGPSNNNAQNYSTVRNDIGLTAIMSQSKNSVPQVYIQGTFWTAMGTLGNELMKDSWNPDDREAARKLINNTVASIRNE